MVTTNHLFWIPPTNGPPNNGEAPVPADMSQRHRGLYYWVRWMVGGQEEDAGNIHKMRLLFFALFCFSRSICPSLCSSWRYVKAKVCGELWPTKCYSFLYSSASRRKVSDLTMDSRVNLRLPQIWWREKGVSTMVLMYRFGLISCISKDVYPRNNNPNNYFLYFCVSVLPQDSTNKGFTEENIIYPSSSTSGMSTHRWR